MPYRTPGQQLVKVEYELTPEELKEAVTQWLYDHKAVDVDSETSTRWQFRASNGETFHVDTYRIVVTDLVG